MMRRKLFALLAVLALCTTAAGPVVAKTALPAGASPAAGAPAAPISATDPTKVPHYFGPWPNWANSPLTLPDVQVNITGGGGIGAAATATIGANGAVTGLAITDPGSGYTSAPTVTFGGAGDGASATASVNTTGSVTGVTVTSGGAGYTAPVVSFAGGSALPVTRTVGNPLVDRAYATDYSVAPVVIPASVTQVANHTVAVTAGNATGGTFTLTVDAVTSAPIAFDANAATVAGALTGATVTGNGPWTIVFVADNPNVTIDGSGLTRGVTDAVAAVGATPDVWNVSVGSATAGNLTLDVDGLLAGPIAFNALSTDVDATLAAAGVSTAVPTTGTGAGNDPWVVTFVAPPTLVTPSFAGLTQPATGFAVTTAATYSASVGTAIGGTFMLTVDGATTPALAFDATAATVEAALTGATVSGTGPWTIVFASASVAVNMDGSGLAQPTAPALVPVFTVVPTALPVGTLTAFQTWNQATTGGSSAPSAGNTFYAYVLRPTGADYAVVYRSNLLTVLPVVDPLGEVVSYPMPDVPVQSGDVLGFYGAGIPVDIDPAGLDVVAYPAPTAPVINDVITIGSAGFPALGQARTYSFAATVSDTSGVLPVTTTATATAFGGVDAVMFSDFGSGYTMPTVDFDFPDDPAGVQAEGHTMCVATTGPNVACSDPGAATPLVITSVVIDTAGSGYSAAPGVVIRDGTASDPILVATPAVVTVSLVIQTIVVDTFGSGYQVAPTVTITDQNGTGALATATIDAGIVSTLTLNSGGSGYLTPGIKKFEDALPGLCLPPACPTTGKYIPLAVPENRAYNGVDADEYVIGLVQYKTNFSSSLPDTLARGYIQLETPANASISQHWPVTNTLMDGTQVPVMKADGVSQWLAVTPPQWLGPTIGATKDKAVRIEFHNLLPTGAAGDLFLPTDSSLMGSGMGPMDMPAPTNNGTVLDGVRNPECTTSGIKPAMCFTDNRATLHLHGGTTPWISDGTPHQWITPAGETTMWPHGVSVQNVPDMNVCGATDDGCQTFYYTNEQSARLMFYHDHAWGITRLNVYAGEAAGYLITDDTEKKLIIDGTIPGAADTIQLVVKDRTFVPGAAQLAMQDPTWDAAAWGGKGSFWYHHVYMPAQNPGDPSGMSAYGRWMYGPWFWPPATPQNGPIANPYYDPACKLDVPSTWTYDTDPFCEPELIPGTPNISVGMEQFNDTPIVNGVAYPTITLEPKTYRLRMLNAANDRFMNFQWYVGEAATASASLNKAGQVIGATEVALNAAEVAAAQTDINVFPTPVQGPVTAGPDWIQIGTEGGFLPAPTVIDGQQPTTWIIDPTRFDVGNVDKHSLLLAPAERADAIVDFSKFAGKTLILYNDAPAAFPARVASYYYYTGAPDTGAWQIIPGYGPNTRTVMQVKIAGTDAAPAFNLTKLQNAFKHHADGSGVFESGQHPIIVGQAAYNSAYGKTFAASGNCTDPNGTNKCDGLARINQQGGDLFRFDNLKGSSPQLKIPLQPKALHDEMNSAAFDEFGRMTANLGLEAVPATPAGQNILLYPYIAPPTEVIDGTNLPKGDFNVQAISSATDGTQIWKITHNGVDTHPIHFHLYDVQVLNRVTWDNIIIPTEASELGWKDTIRVSPLEDTIVALRPVVPTLPFEIPNSIRELNPMMPDGANLDPNGLIVDPSGNVTTLTNALVNFGWEYVYHCHILSHEEMDMMRPVLLALPPYKASGLNYSVTGNGNNTRLTLTWTDNSITETSFLVQKQAGATEAWTTIGTINVPLNRPNTTGGTRSFTDINFRWNSTVYSYRVIARNTVGYGGAYPQVNADSTSVAIPALQSPTGLAGTLQAGTNPGPVQVSLAWTDNLSIETGFAIERSTNGGTFAQIATAPARAGTGGVTFVDLTVTTGNTYAYRVADITLLGNSGYSNIVTVVVPAVPTAPSAVTVQNGANQGSNRSVIVRWSDNSNNESGFTVQRATNAGFTTGVATTNAAANATTVTVTGLSRNTAYWFRVRANNGAIVSTAWVPLTPASILTNP